MMDKMLTSDSSIKPKVALAWSITAANSLENVNGFTPFQQVFGEQPVLPSLMTCGPSGMADPQVSADIAASISAMHLAREAYIACEHDRVLAEALNKKNKVYTGAGEISPGM